MKKIFSTLFSLAISSSLFSLPIGNPADPVLYPIGIITGCEDPCCFNWHIRAGYSGDFVYNRNLTVKRPPLPRGRLVRETNIWTNSGFLALNLNDRIDIFSTLGQSKFTLRANEQVFGGANTFDGLLFTNTDFSWSIGTRALLLYWQCFSLGVEGQYFQANPKLDKYFDRNGGTYFYFDADARVKYDEWQLGSALSYTIQRWCPSLGITPYIGVKWARASFDANNETIFSVTPLTIFDLKAHKQWGYAAGATLHFCNCIGFTAEGRWGDEKALYINGQMSF